MRRKYKPEHLAWRCPLPSTHAPCPPLPPKQDVYIVFYYLKDAAEINGVFWTYDGAKADCEYLETRGLKPWVEQYGLNGYVRE